MAWKQEDLERIERAIADSDGIQEVRFSDVVGKLYSVAELRELREMIRREVTPRRTHRLAVVSKGT